MKKKTTKVAELMKKKVKYRVSPSGKTVPMAIHKGVVIKALQDHPGLAKELYPDTPSAEEAIKALEEHDGEWFVGNTLLASDDPDLPEHLRKKEPDETTV